MHYGDTRVKSPVRDEMFIARGFLYKARGGENALHLLRRVLFRTIRVRYKHSALPERSSQNYREN
jgi:hypothetical protein